MGNLKEILCLKCLQGQKTPQKEESPTTSNAKVTLQNKSNRNVFSSYERGDVTCHMHTESENIFYANVSTVR